jgi:hypothetical protein
MAEQRVGRPERPVLVPGVPVQLHQRRAARLVRPVRPDRWRAARAAAIGGSTSRLHSLGWRSPPSIPPRV